MKRKSQRSATPNDSNLYNQCVKQISIIINERIKLDRNKKSKPGDRSFWRISKNLRGKSKKNIPYLIAGNNNVVSEEEKANTLADTIEYSYV